MANEKRESMTAAAKTAFADWVWHYSDQWLSEGADPAEIREDVESHLHAKSDELGRLLSVEDLESVLGEMALPMTNEAAAERPKSKGGLLKRIFYNRFFLGVWPLLIILIEGASGIFGETIFDPISRMSQLILLLGVGIVAAMGQYMSEEKKSSKWFSFLLGVGLVPAVYWGLLCLPVVLMGGAMFVYAVIGTFGIGLLALPLVLICMAIAATPILASFGFWNASRVSRWKSAWLAGLGGGLLALLIVEVPGYVTRYGLAEDDPALVRAWGSEELLAQLATERTWGMGGEDTSGFIWNLKSTLRLSGGRYQSVDDVVRKRRFYYRVTGKDPLKPENMSFLSRQRKSYRSFDSDMGGDEVGGVVTGLDLSESRLDGHVDGASGLGYWEWTMVFSNREENQKEARMQLLLPPGGVVSRLTLWVNDEPQEAAFGPRSQVTAAYKSVVKRRRDPVLVRWIGGDRVLVQCFPVPPHSTMKIRVGMTAPLDGSDRLFLPRLVERNFAFDEDLETAVWVQGDVEMSMEGLEGKGAVGRWREIHGKLSLDGLTAKHTHVSCHELSKEEVVWTEDQFAEAKSRYLVRKLLPVKEQEPRKVVLVVDGSHYFEDWSASFREALNALRAAGHEVKVLYAAEEGVVGEGEDPSFVGGQDNLPALLRGVELASEMKAMEMIWLHGEQPVALKNAESFVQLMQRGFHQVRVSTMDLSGGPNRLLEQIQTSFPIESVGRPSGPDDLERELLRVVSRNDQLYQYSRVAEGDVPEGTKVWDHLARWRVWEDVKREATANESRAQLAKRASRYQLVTPVSGAVVLETHEQFKRFGLDQVDASTAPSIPGIPEPSTSFLVLISSMMMWRRKRAAA